MKSKDEIYSKWKHLVNMSYGELKAFYDSPEGKEAGLTPQEAKEHGIHSGRESARWIMKMKQTPKDEWTDTMWEWANRQISFISRMSGNRGKLYDDKGNKTRKYLSLLIWGNNPEKHSKMKHQIMEDGAEIEFDESIEPMSEHFEQSLVEKEDEGYRHEHLEVEMTLANVERIKEYAEKIDDIVRDDQELEAWVVAKMARVEIRMVDIKQAMKFEKRQMKMEAGGELIKSMCLHISKYAQAIKDMIHEGVPVMAWMDNNLAITSAYIDDVFHHLDYVINKEKKFNRGGRVNIVPESDRYKTLLGRKADGGSVARDFDAEYEKVKNFQSFKNFGVNEKTGRTFALASERNPKFEVIAQYLVYELEKRGYQNAGYSQAKSGTIYVYKDGIGSSEWVRISDHMGRGGLWAAQYDISTLEEAKKIISSVKTHKEVEAEAAKARKSAAYEFSKRIERLKKFKKEIQDRGLLFSVNNRTYASPSEFQSKHPDFEFVKATALDNSFRGQAYKYEYLKPDLKVEIYDYLPDDNYIEWFFSQTNSEMHHGGKLIKLEKKVAKEYMGEHVAPKYQKEYGKRYSAEEAKEVGAKVAGKVKANIFKKYKK